MSEWKPKRFWKQVTVEGRASEATGGAMRFHVLLDGRPVRTPLKAELALPTKAMADAVAAEWDAQTEVVDPLRMSVTRSANAALDKVTAQHAEVVDMLAAYAETDLLCHRAVSPEELKDLQTRGWQPILDWAETRFSAPLRVVEGILPAKQPQTSLDAYRAELAQATPFELTALHDLIGLSGSLVLGLWVAHGEGRAETAWELSRIDEDWQISQWGEDDDAKEQADLKRRAFLHAAHFLTLARTA